VHSVWLNGRGGRESSLGAARCQAGTVPDIKGYFTAYYICELRIAASMQPWDRVEAPTDQLDLLPGPVQQHHHHHHHHSSLHVFPARFIAHIAANRPWCKTSKTPPGDQ
jgi:hypothetical protein